MLQDELVVLIHNLKVANASLVLANLVASVESSADVRAEVITRVQLFIANMFSVLFFRETRMKLTLVQDYG
jgi:hypothetical protein